MALWYLFLIIGGRGGIGKSLLATLLTIALLRLGKQPALLQADIQHRLELLFPDMVETISIDQLEALAENPMAVAQAFSAIPRRMRECAAARQHVIVDTAATWHTPVIRWAAESRLDRKVANLGGRLIFCVPTTADLDSLELTVETVRMIEALQLAAETVVFLNHYPARPSLDAPALVAKFGKSEINRITKSTRQIVMPAIVPAIWGPFERANLSPLDVVGADPKDLVEIAKTDVDTVEIMQGRVAKWLNDFNDKIDPLFKTRDE